MDNYPLQKTIEGFARYRGIELLTLTPEEFNRKELARDLEESKLKRDRDFVFEVRSCIPSLNYYHQEGHILVLEELDSSLQILYLGQKVERGVLPIKSRFSERAIIQDKIRRADLSLWSRGDKPDSKRGGFYAVSDKFVGEIEKRAFGYDSLALVCSVREIQFEATPETFVGLQNFLQGLFPRDCFK